MAKCQIGGSVKNFIIKLLITFGVISFFKGTSEDFKVHAREQSGNSAALRSDSGMGGRTGGCGKSG